MHTRVVIIGVAAIIPMGKTVPQVTCTWGVYLCTHVSDRETAMQGSAYLGYLLHGPHLCFLFPSWSIPHAQPHTTRVCPFCQVCFITLQGLEAVQRKEAERRAGKGVLELPGPQTVDGIEIKGFCPAVIPLIALCAVCHKIIATLSKHKSQERREEV